ncbi:hypothetical protein A2911_02145 [Candidatus Nomurabacteria bacterium RIFCSPLOWO2_01_FULL_40_15]|uniref:Baseplate protein J-like domain-containing protein n=1 Tax=Candidatus Nomurabacteria bacterium RIFCSPLOWO2_01_FULL_40_15 TaxID=1801772 RepID=A0A1F6X839_9BACT|nr:MAG: hypothetical protein A2911_02145 [Candidatus Nomurabacteria bacterium RIFCSPLOWO2_01_FULL_40_15]
MSKNLLQDMVKRKNTEVVKKPVISIPDEPEKVQYPKVETKFASVYEVSNKSSSDKKSRHTLWFVAVASIAFFLFALSFLFSQAKITINPKIQNLILNENLFATKDGKQEDLPFKLVVVSGEENKTAQAGVEKDVALKAKGRVVIFNTFSSSSQVLAIDTRLEGSNGKIYKTEKKLTVPGVSTNGTPGSVEVGIYGSEAGEEYNSPPLDFKIFGFKGTPKYAKFYARSKGEITGGLVGKSSNITEVEKEKTVNELKVLLKDKLFKKVADQIPAGFILWENAVVLNSDDENIKFTSKDNMVSVNMKGTLSGFLFEEKKLTEKIVAKTLPDQDGSLVYIPNIKNLTFSLAPSTSLPNGENSLTDVNNISFNLSGNLKIVWIVDEDKVITDMLGKRKNNFNQILAEYPNIDSAQLVLRPFWKRFFPKKAKDIQTIVNYPE